jgi:hypothetical protein
VRCNEAVSSSSYSALKVNKAVSPSKSAFNFSTKVNEFALSNQLLWAVYLKVELHFIYLCFI